MLIGVVVGIGLAVIALRLLPRVLRAFGRRVTRTQAEWQIEVEAAAIAAVHADLEAGRAKAWLIELIGSIPSEFDASAWLGCNIAAGVQRAVLQRAEEEGLIRPGLVDVVFPPAVAEPPAAYEPEPMTSNVRRLPSGRVVPKRAEG